MMRGTNSSDAVCVSSCEELAERSVDDTVIEWHRRAEIVDERSTFTAATFTRLQTPQSGQLQHAASFTSYHS